MEYEMSDQDMRIFTPRVTAVFPEEAVIHWDECCTEESVTIWLPTKR